MLVAELGFLIGEIADQVWRNSLDPKRRQAAQLKTLAVRRDRPIGRLATPGCRPGDKHRACFWVTRDCPVDGEHLKRFVRDDVERGLPVSSPASVTLICKGRRRPHHRATPRRSGAAAATAR